MPELPEVENVRRSLEAQGTSGQVFARIELLRSNLRTPLSRDLTRKLPGQKLLQLSRRAKFLLFETEDYLLISHLGMTGSWRPGPAPLEKHDHVVLHFQSGLQLIYNDPRRFGLLEINKRNKPSAWLAHLGVEPLDPQFDGERLFTMTRKLKAPIKNVIMDQRKVVGVGNIYASEALFKAGIKPTRPATKVTRAEAEALANSIRQVLARAIEAGGSTIRDYRNAQGESGRFQAQFAVYGRSGEDCPRCGHALKSRFLAGRNTFWCSQCQR